MVIHGHEDEFPADVSSALGTVPSDAMPRLVESPQFLGVDVEQFARCFTLVALNWLLGLKVAQARQPSAPQHTADGGLGLNRTGF